MSESADGEVGAFSSSDSAIQGLRIWRTFMDWLDPLSDSRWVFRGHDQVGYALCPSIGRTRFDVVRERELFTQFSQSAAEFISLADKSTLDLLAVAQHHKVPTRLLDWTTNPLIAAWFATIGTDACDAAIVAVPLTTSSLITADADPFTLAATGFFKPRAVTRRITSQSGLFTVHADPAAEWRPQGRKTFIIPAQVRSYFARRLFFVGIDAQHVMGGLDGLGERLRWQYVENIGLGG